MTWKGSECVCVQWECNNEVWLIGPDCEGPLEGRLKAHTTIYHIIGGQQCWVTEGLHKPTLVNFPEPPAPPCTPPPPAQPHSFQILQSRWGDIKFHGIGPAQLHPFCLSMKGRQTHKQVCSLLRIGFSVLSEWKHPSVLSPSGDGTQGRISREQIELYTSVVCTGVILCRCFLYIKCSNIQVWLTISLTSCVIFLRNERARWISALGQNVNNKKSHDRTSKFKTMPPFF